MFHFLPSLLAQAGDAATLSDKLGLGTKFLIAIGLIVGSYMLGRVLSQRLRMVDHGWKIGLVAFAVLAGSVIVGLGQPRFGIDLEGGTILVYQVDEQSQEKGYDMDEMIDAIKRRLDPGSTKQITVRAYGQGQIEIIIPKASPAEVQQYKLSLTKLGTLEFRIVPNVDHTTAQGFVRLAYQAPSGQYEVIDGGRVVANWVPMKNKPEIIAEHHTPRDGESLYNLRGYVTREVKSTIEGVPDEIQILVLTDPYNVNGEHLSRIEGGVGEQGFTVFFNFDAVGAQKFGGLTGANIKRQLGVILDGYFNSTATINDVISSSGQISGSFSEKERDDLVEVLNAGKLPAKLVDRPISELTTDATLGRDTVDRAFRSMAVSMALVLVFMMVFYRFSGVVACMALVLNLVLILGAMISVRAAFTLPGLAGLVLTVGMAVDANVLIFERIREELSRGAALRMAIRNGFSRATTTIVDANLTTLITAIVLYAIGTDQVRGFAVILILGILMSMFTAIFCSRLVFDIAEKRRWISRLSMMHLFGATKIDFIGKRRLAGAFSVALIVMGLVAVVMRGRNILNIDFTGGTSSQIVFDSNQVEIAKVRIRVSEWNSDTRAADRDALVAKLGPELTQTIQQTLGEEIRQPLESELRRGYAGDVEKLEAELEKDSKKLEDALGDLEIELAAEIEKLDVEYGTPEQIGAFAEKPVADLSDDEFARLRALATLPDAAMSEIEPISGERDRKRFLITTSNRSVDAVEGTLAKIFKGELATQSMKFTLTKIETPAPVPGDDKTNDDKTNDDKTNDDKTNDDKTDNGKTNDDKTDNDKSDDGKSDDGKSGGEGDQDGDEVVGSRFTLAFGEPMSHDPVVELIERKLDTDVSVQLSAPGWRIGGTMAAKEWTATLNVPEEVAVVALEAVQDDVASRPLFPATNNIGGQVASSMRRQGIVALVASLICIVIYIWVRFQKVSFGLAAVVALVHDVLITLGFLALSKYLMGVPFIDSFKISLDILAAFLTIIGYSLNDTIVVFDRIREVRGKSPDLTSDMVNKSINQTLSRTLLTSMTTLIVVLILFFFAGQGIHGFAFALVVGVLAGTYSSIFVASPVLLWLLKSPVGKGKGTPAMSQREPSTV